MTAIYTVVGIVALATAGISAHSQSQNRKLQRRHMDEQRKRVQHEAEAAAVAHKLSKEKDSEVANVGSTNSAELISTGRRKRQGTVSNNISNTLGL